MLTILTTPGSPIEQGDLISNQDLTFTGDPHFYTGSPIVVTILVSVQDRHSYWQSSPLATTASCTLQRRPMILEILFLSYCGFLSGLWILQPPSWYLEYTAGLTRCVRCLLGFTQLLLFSVLFSPLVPLVSTHRPPRPPTHFLIRLPFWDFALTRFLVELKPVDTYIPAPSSTVSIEKYLPRFFLF